VTAARIAPVSRRQARATVLTDEQQAAALAELLRSPTAASACWPSRQAWPSAYANESDAPDLAADRPAVHQRGRDIALVTRRRTATSVNDNVARPAQRLPFTGL